MLDVPNSFPFMLFRKPLCSSSLTNCRSTAELVSKSRSFGLRWASSLATSSNPSVVGAGISSVQTPSRIESGSHHLGIQGARVAGYDGDRAFSLVFKYCRACASAFT